MAKMWRMFRESEPRSDNIPAELFTIEIFHGGYFFSMPDGTKKYKLAKFNKLGGKLYLDGLDPDKFAWVELNNIAWELGYREKPISYHFKIPRTTSNEGWMPIKNDADAVEMMKLIPPKKRQISVYITGGGRRKKIEAELDDTRPTEWNWHNPLNDVTAAEKAKVVEDSNLFASQINMSYRGNCEVSGPEKVNVVGNATVNVVGDTNVNAADDDVIKIDSESESGLGQSQQQHDTQSTFAGLSDLVSDLFGGSQQHGIQSEVGHGCSNNDVQGQSSNLVVNEGSDNVWSGFNNSFSSPRSKHTAKRPWNSKKAAIGNQNTKQHGEGLAKSVEQAAKTSRPEQTTKTSRPEQTAKTSIPEQPAKTSISDQAVHKKESNNTKKTRLSVADKGKNVAAEGKLASGPKKRGKTTKEVRYNTRNKGSKKFESVQESDSSEEGSDFYVDSDYDLRENDDDADFEHNVSNPRVVEEYEEMGFAGVCSDDGGDTDELESLNGSETEEDEDGNPTPKKSSKGVNVKAWRRSIDLKNPIFTVGQAFPNAEVLKEAVREFAIKNHLGLWFQKNWKYKIEVKCQWGCPFWMYASIRSGEGDTLYIKTLKNEHKCSPVLSSHYLNYNRIASEIAEDLLVDEDWSRSGIQNYIQKKYGLDVGVQTITRGKRKAKRMNEGHYIDQYNKLASYKNELLRSNPGSTVEIKTEMDGTVRRFHRMYICFAACKEGWIKGCRPLIGLDGCHIKGHHPGQLLAAVGIDANNGMFPIAFAVAEVENTDSWRWFLDYLKVDLKMERDRSYTFITDKQKGLGNAISELFPAAEHRHCVRHFYNNFKGKHPGEGLKQTLWNAARSSTRVWFDKHMEEMRNQSEEAFKWFEDKIPAHWTRSHFKDITKCDTLLNNLCESFNAAILPARDKPIITMLEKIRMDMMVRMANRRVACTTWRDMVGPRIKKIVDKVGQRAIIYRAHMAGEFEYQVTGGGDLGSKHAVDLGRHICTCRRWQLSGIPCVHAICAIRAKQQEPALYCDDYLMPSMYLAAYSPIIHPIAGQDDWDVVEYPIAPPPYKKQVGRPKTKRVKEPGENKQPPASNTTRMPKTGVRMTCQICKKQGHNRLGCPITKASKASQTAGEGSSSGVKPSTRKRPRMQQVKTTPAPKNSMSLKDQIIKSRKTWKKRKTMDSNSSHNENVSQSTSVQRPLTQSSQNLAAQRAQKQKDQSSSEWAGF